GPQYQRAEAVPTLSLTAILVYLGLELWAHCRVIDANLPCLPANEKPSPFVFNSTQSQTMQADATEGHLFIRRVLFAVSFVVTMVGFLGLAMLALAPGGWGLLDIVTLILLSVVLPWMVAGFWNAVIGFVILRFAADPAAEVLPAIKGVRGD